MISCSKLLYKENDRKYIIGVESMLGPGMEAIVLLTYIKNWYKADNSPISNERMKNILVMSEQLFQSTGMKVKVLLSNPQMQGDHRIRSGLFGNVSKLAV